MIITITLYTILNICSTILLSSSCSKKFIYHLKYAYREKFAVSDNLMDKDSEAMKVTKGIVEEMAQEAHSKRAQFSLIILPTIVDIKEYKENPSYKKSWDEMASYICSGKIVCYDLMEDFSRLPVETLDTGYDGSHYGPKTNALIADFILKNAFFKVTSIHDN